MEKKTLKYFRKFQICLKFVQPNACRKTKIDNANDNIAARKLFKIWSLSKICQKEVIIMWNYDKSILAINISEFFDL